MIHDILGPRQLVLVTAREEIELLGRTEEKDEITVTSFHTAISTEPFLYLISLKKEELGVELIRKSHVFCVNFMPQSQEVMSCIGKHLDKFQESGLTKEESDRIDLPRIKEAVAFLDCEVIEEIERGDSIIFIGKVIYYEERRKAKRLYNKL